MHRTMQDYLYALVIEGRGSTVPNYRTGLVIYDAYLGRRGIDPLKATTEDLRAFQRWLSEEHRKSDGRPLAKNTQVTRLATVKAYYTHLARRGVILADPARRIKLPAIPGRDVTHDHLEQQEVIALIQCQAGNVEALKNGSWRRAVAHRNLTLLCMAVATGQRVSTLRAMRVKDLDFRRNEVRVEWVKGGKPGRVLPVSGWAMSVSRDHVKDARKVLLAGRRDKGWLFVGTETDQIIHEYLNRLLKRLQRQTIDENPDLEDLPDKHLKAHGLRVSFAVMMFLNGCDIRTINELLLHRKLTTTARYTPIPLQDLRRALRTAHPRA